MEVNLEVENCELSDVVSKLIGKSVTLASLLSDDDTENVSVHCPGAPPESIFPKVVAWSSANLIDVGEGSEQSI